MYSPINDIHTVSTFSSYFPSDRRREVLLIHFILVRYWGHNLADHDESNNKHHQKYLQEVSEQPGFAFSFYHVFPWVRELVLCQDGR